MDRQIVLAFLLVAAAVPYTVGLGSSSLWDANESFYAEAARTMVETGDYVSPSFNGQPRFNKPILSYWFIAGSYRVFGVSEGAERIPIAAGALVLIAVTFALGRLVGSRYAGLLAAIVLATSPRFLMFARRIIVDVHLAAFTGLALLGFALAEAYPARRRACLVLMYVAMALGTLTKGPVAVVVPGLAILLYLAWERRLRDLGRMLAPTGAVVGAAIVLPWYVLVYQAHGWEHILSFVFDENLGRYAQTVGGSDRGPLFYLPIALDFLFPWSLFVPLALWDAARRRAGPEAGADGEPPEAGGGGAPDGTRIRRSRRLLVCWIAAFVGFFSLSSTKQDLYILPIVPAAAALVGAMLAAAADRGPAGAGSLVRPAATATGAVLLAASTALLVVFVAPGHYPLAGVGAAAAVVASGALTVIVLAVRRRPFEAVTAVGASFAVASWIFVLFTLPDFERYKPVRPLAAAISSRAGPTAVIGSYRLGIPSLVYYLRRPMVDLHAPEQINDAFSSGDDVYFVMTERDYREIRTALPVQTYVIDQHRRIDAHLGNLLAGRAFPQLVLVSNRRP